MNRLKVFLAVVIAATLLAYLTIIVGGDLTATDSGLACGANWPFCPGGIIPSNLNNPSVLREFSHRVVAFATSLLLLVTLVLALLWYRREPRILYLSVGPMGLLVIQVVLGMVTVQSDLSPDIVTAHLALGTATFGAALVLAVVTSMRPPGEPVSRGQPGKASLHQEVDEQHRAEG